jgi:dTDP-4-dehydrorhamnose 3,5-epimerase
VRFIGTELDGVVIVELERLEDERGFFARTFSSREFEQQGLAAEIVQCSVSYNKQRGTLRGLHYQAKPQGECRLVRCTAGAIFDIAVDIRRSAGTFLEWQAVELTAESRRALYIPEGFAHGFQTLANDTEVFYQMSRAYHRPSARGIRWNDPSLAIEWPLEPTVMSARDRGYPDLDPGDLSRTFP